jgi:hypothetical protein
LAGHLLTLETTAYEPKDNRPEVLRGGLQTI